MLKLGELMEQAEGEKKDLIIVVRDYEGILHNLVSDEIRFDRTEDRIILELFNEVEDE